MGVAPTLLHSYPNLKKPNPLAGAPPPILQSYPNLTKPNLVEVYCPPPSFKVTIDSIQAEAELSFSVCWIDAYTYQEATKV